MIGHCESVMQLDNYWRTLVLYYSLYKSLHGKCIRSAKSSSPLGLGLFTVIHVFSWLKLLVLVFLLIVNNFKIIYPVVFSVKFFGFVISSSVISLGTVTRPELLSVVLSFFQSGSPLDFCIVNHLFAFFSNSSSIS